MSTLFEVTDLGLTLDGRALLPGSKLIIKGAPHTGWNGCGRVAGEVTEQRLQVATPLPTTEAEEDDALESARAEHERLTGKRPHHKASLAKILADIEAHNNGSKV